MKQCCIFTTLCVIACRVDAHFVQAPAGGPFNEKKLCEGDDERSTHTVRVQLLRQKNQRTTSKLLSLRTCVEEVRMRNTATEEKILEKSILSLP